MSKGQPVGKQLYNTIYQNHSRQDHDPKLIYQIRSVNDSTNH